ncbi:MAG: hypothetical protein ABW100_08495 [Candidatus Thiodiazotropha sp. 6PLUC3]
MTGVMARLSYAPILLLLVLSLGCAKKGSVSERHDGAFSKPSTWLISAARHEQKGDLQKALYEYRIARTLSGKSRKIEKKIESLKAQIEDKSKRLLSTAKKAHNKGDLKSAEKLFFEILALDPQHDAALKGLRRINRENLKLKMQKKVAISQGYQKKRSNRESKNNYHDEGYVYSRQAILQAEHRASDVTTYIEELEKHILKYPRDTELKNMLMKIRVVQARAAFKLAKYEKSLHHLTKAEKVFIRDPSAIKMLHGLRKELGKNLYLKGVRTVREEPVKAVELWKTALKFDPDDKKSQIRIKNLEKRL